MAMIKLENVNKSFGDLHVLKDVNLEVEEGEKLVIIGPSGSGKSTTVRCMNFLEMPSSGGYNDKKIVKAFAGHIEEAHRAGCAFLDTMYIDKPITQSHTIIQTVSRVNRSFAGKDSGLILNNLRTLLDGAGPERITVRVPLIPEYNTKEDQAHSADLLRSMGFEKLDLFDYLIRS